MNIWKLTSVLLISSFLGACNSEDDITPTEGLEEWYELPQGNHDYDDQIVAWNEKYGFYPLYIFEDKDLYWHNTGWTEWRPKSEYEMGGGLLGVPADTNYVGQQLELFEEWFLTHWPDKYLQYMPKKLMLCSELWNAETELVFNPDGTYKQKVKKTFTWIFGGYGLVAINGGNSEILNITREDQIKFAQVMGSYFAAKLIADKQIIIPEAFRKLGEPYYIKNNQSVRGPKLFEIGLLNCDALSGVFTEKSALSSDFRSYMTLVLGNTFEKLSGKLDNIGNYDTNPALGGVLNRERDVNGLVSRKYNVVVEYLKECGVDVDFYQYYNN